MEKKRILIVDDAPVTITQIRRQLEEAGYIVSIAANGLEGMSVVSTYNVDLIITDIVMPVMDGVDFYKELKKNERTQSIPVMVITDSVVIKESFQALGVNEFIAKPIDGRDLLQRVQWLLDL
jgi:CheY-like chemotaxis protein